MNKVSFLDPMKNYFHDWIDKINEISFLRVNAYFLFILLFFFLLLLGEWLKKNTRVDWKVRKKSYKSNFLIVLFNNMIIFLISGTSLYWVAANNSFHWLGYLKKIDLEWLRFIISFLLFDFIIYGWHILNHKVPFLWSFHRCHHSDKDLNSTTGFRFHLGELFLSIFYKSFFILLLGFEANLILFYETMILVFSIFHHSDIIIILEKQLKYLIVVPEHHATHHSTIRDHHDSNYGVVFSFWDRLFKTYDSYQPKEFGLINENEKSFFPLLTFAFKKHNILLIASVFLFLFFLHQYLIS